MTEDSEKKKETGDKSDMEILEDIQSRFVVDIKSLPDTIDVSTYSSLSSHPPSERLSPLSDYNLLITPIMVPPSLP